MRASLLRIDMQRENVNQGVKLMPWVAKSVFPLAKNVALFRVDKEYIPNIYFFVTQSHHVVDGRNPAQGGTHKGY